MEKPRWCRIEEHFAPALVRSPGEREACVAGIDVTARLLERFNAECCIPAHLEHRLNQRRAETRSRPVPGASERGGLIHLPSFPGHPGDTP